MDLFLQFYFPALLMAGCLEVLGRKSHRVNKLWAVGVWTALTALGSISVSFLFFHAAWNLSFEPDPDVGVWLSIGAVPLWILHVCRFFVVIVRRSGVSATE